jgi:hypothetical protein
MSIVQAPNHKHGDTITSSSNKEDRSSACFFLEEPRADDSKHGDAKTTDRNIIGMNGLETCSYQKIYVL